MTRSDTVVSVTKVTQTWNNVLVLIQAFVNSSSDDLHIGILGLECLDSLWRCQQVQKEDSPLESKTSTAIMALPPVANIGSNKKTYLSLMSSGNFS